jgi:hypothetical protein
MMKDPSPPVTVLFSVAFSLTSAASMGPFSSDTYPYTAFGGSVDKICAVFVGKIPGEGGAGCSSVGEAVEVAQPVRKSIERKRIRGGNAILISGSVFF